ncbi:hypothetical protein WR25_23617 [Diploscapter pachys]|uniref:Peptidase M13 N-terminal domain-containing protein n=1 Tax=Diploscapter pachys TaxID=2018661 RepID=A0A2A2J6U1_9BILA|nr:hypothetical protein WR25_23617 [Diploscapter pachys]
MKGETRNGLAASTLWHHPNKRSCFGRLTRLEICLLITTVILFLSLISVILSWLILLNGYRTFIDGPPIYPVEFENSSTAVDRTAKHHGEVVCTSKECTLLAAFLAENLNPRADPCEDFYEFACGNYGLNRVLPANKPARNTIMDVQARLGKQIKSVLEQPLRDDEPIYDRLPKGYFHKCLDEEELERTGLQAIKEVVDWVGGWPAVVGDNWQQWNYTWEEQLARVLNKTGVNAVILEMSVTHDPANSSRSVIEMDQPKWGVGSRHPYLNGEDDPLIKNYTHLMKMTAIHLGADPSRVEKEIKETVDLELKLVNFSADEIVRRDPERGNNRYQLWQLKQAFPLINFEKYVQTAFKELVNVSLNHTVIVREIDYFAGIQHILSSTPKRVIANYIAWRLVQEFGSGFSPLLPPTVREIFYEFKANQTGMFNSPPPDRYEDCVTLACMVMDMPTGKLFVEHFFEKERSMNKLNELTAYLKNEFIKQLKVLDWMDETTRERAIQKANMIDYKSGFPEYLFNDTWMMQNWGIPLIPNEYLLHLTIRIKLYRHVDDLRRLNTPLDSGQYDSLGNLNDWWDAETAEKFHEKTRCFVRQYGSIHIEEAGIDLNGQLSLGENIADNGGLKNAFHAYKTWKANTSVAEPALPGFQNFTSEQMFFLAYANNWCALIRPKYYVQLALTDVHSPSKYRAIVPLKNRLEFAEAYNCPTGSQMNPEKKCQVW